MWLARCTACVGCTCGSDDTVGPSADRVCSYCGSFGDSWSFLVPRELSRVIRIEFVDDCAWLLACRFPGFDAMAEVTCCRCDVV